MSYQRSEIKHLDNYAEALAKWEGTKHIRGRAEDQCADDKDRLWQCLNHMVDCFQSKVPSQLGLLEKKQAIKLAVACLNATKVDDI
jgi:hypothetical protein